ncbi:hypothetical protein CAOG_01521 [Capsaspora owczarzaki ATCC 30864]|uniref:Profilin n=1 Tax=Capsaspora owczarzaki (strain ATCC 30864) TaxID=595528 RepID=A0A0D2U4V4_CAPO3|nr:hypothetical protein CAOG_01521 [Capsaspora owczarzaki ATCC 30864]KJE90176.1 hypothetical protein CAOG_001521 [Capsaspora owczarzaki ATCC 30864]|eukprot:XP_004364389.1 hypothetical protein CAOG_01521 [Capsaspora owczarzaki ATCC 30864]
MSWQAYVDTNLLGTKLVSKAAIHGLDGNPWATSAGFKVDKAEAAALVAAIGKKEPSDLYASGIKLGGQKFTFLRHEQNRSVYGRKGADSGCCVVKTKQAIVIGVFEGGIQPGQCNSVVERLADYLIENQY